MQTATAIVVHVVNSGTDWLALAAVISTGVVGLAGIGASVWTFGRGERRRAERDRLLRKRRLYARCLAVLNRCNEARVHFDVHSNSQPASAGLNKAIAAAIRVTYELTLIAPANIAALSGKLVMILGDTNGSDANYAETFAALMNAMRADVGEPPYAEPVRLAPLPRDGSATP